MEGDEKRLKTDTGSLDPSMFDAPDKCRCLVENAPELAARLSERTPPPIWKLPPRDEQELLEYIKLVYEDKYKTVNNNMVILGVSTEINYPNQIDKK